MCFSWIIFWSSKEDSRVFHRQFDLWNIICPALLGNPGICQWIQEFHHLIYCICWMAVRIIQVFALLVLQDLSDNKLGSMFAERFAHVLNQNNTLTHIRLSGRCDIWCSDPLKSVKCYHGGRKIDLIPPISEIQSKMCYYCVQYTRRHLMSLISLC